MRVFFCLLLSLLYYTQEVSALANYKECLECFYANRTTTYYCQTNRRCLPLRSTQCSAANIIYRDY